MLKQIPLHIFIPKNRILVKHGCLVHLFCVISCKFFTRIPLNNEYGILYVLKQAILNIYRAMPLMDSVIYELVFLYLFTETIKKEDV